MEAATIGYVVFAIIEMIASSAVSDAQMKSSEQRNARETQVRKFYQAAKDAFGVTQNQLTDYAERLGIKLNDLSTAARGSARLSRASAQYRNFVRRYPQTVNAVNQARNKIQEAINYLNSQESAKATTIQQRGSVSNQEIMSDVYNGTQMVNSAVGGLTEGTVEGPRTGDINLSLKQSVDHESEGPTKSDAINQFIEENKDSDTYRFLHEKDGPKTKGIK